MVDIVTDPSGGIVSGARDNIGLWREELEHRKAIREAEQQSDIKGELNARRRLRAVVQAQQPIVPQEPTPWERFGRGGAQLPAGLAQLAPEALGGLSPGEETAFAEGEEIYQQAVPGFDAWSMLGELSGQAPLAAVPGLGPAGVLPRAATGAATEAAIGSAMFADTPEERVRNALAGGIGGAVGTAAVPALAGVGKGLTSVVPRRLPQLERARRSAARKFGYEPTRGQLSRDPIEWGDEQNLAKQEGAEDLQARLGAQRQRDLVNLEDLQVTYGGPRELAEGGTGLERGVLGRSEQWQGKVRDLYETARAERPDLTVPGDRLTIATADVLDDFDVPAAVSRRLTNLAEQPEGIAPVDLEKLDKMLTDNQGINKATDNAMRRLKERVRGVIDEAGETYGGAYREAVLEAKQRFDAIGGLKDIVNRIERGAIDPIKTIPALRSAGVKELNALREFVAETDPDAWQAMRGALASNLAEKATPGGQFSQGAYNTWIKQVGPERLRILFGEAGTDELREFGGVVRDLYGAPRGSTMNTSNTNIAARRGLDGILRRILGSVYLGGIYDVMAESGAKRANARQAMMALDPTKRAGRMDERGLLAGGSRALGAGLGGVLGGELLP